MIEHITLAVKNGASAKKFYAAVLKPLGYTIKYEFGDATGYMEGGHTSFWIVGKPRIVPTHVAFRTKSKKAVAAFYDAALKAGATNNGGPGFRTEYGNDYYAAFVLDEDGNNIEACYFGAKAPKTKKKKTR